MVKFIYYIGGTKISNEFVEIVKESQTSLFKNLMQSILSRKLIDRLQVISLAIHRLRDSYFTLNHYSLCLRLRYTLDRQIIAAHFLLSACSDIVDGLQIIQVLMDIMAIIKTGFNNIFLPNHFLTSISSKCIV